MAAACFSETFIFAYQSILHHNPEAHNPYLPHSETSNPCLFPPMKGEVMEVILPGRNRYLLCITTLIFTNREMVYVIDVNYPSQHSVYQGRSMIITLR
jgi:hypothetical protein